MPEPFIDFNAMRRFRYLIMRTMRIRSEEHTSELQSHSDLVCRLLLEKKKISHRRTSHHGVTLSHCIACPPPARTGDPQNVRSAPRVCSRARSIPNIVKTRSSTYTA